MSRTKILFRNTAFLMSGQVVGWAASLLLWLVVPRIIGPRAWGEYNVGLAVGGIVTSVAGFGVTTHLLKEVARDKPRTDNYVAVALGGSLMLAVPILLVAMAFAWIAGYGLHERLVVIAVTAMSLTWFVVAPAVAALQAHEHMHLNTLVTVVRTVAGTLVVVAVALLLRPDVLVLIGIAGVFALISMALQLTLLRRVTSAGPRFDWHAWVRMARGGMPYWTIGMFLTIYVWVDSVLLSVLASTREVGYYAAPVQVIATLGFLPTLVTTVMFPAMSRGFRSDPERARRLSQVGLQIVICLSLPIAIGGAIVAPRMISDLFGPLFMPSALTLQVLMLTIPSVYPATLAYWILAAADKQRTWAFVMAGGAVVNPLLNLITIRWAASHLGHGSLGAAAALLVTDTAVGIAAFVLIPRSILTPVRPLLAPIWRAALATAIMAILVWMLRDTFFLLPAAAGFFVFVVSAIALGVVSRTQMKQVLRLARRRLTGAKLSDLRDSSPAAVEPATVP